MSEESTVPAYRIATRRLVLRCWAPTDAPQLKASIDASLDHLRPWMPWAQRHPQEVETLVELLRGWRARFDLDQDYVYGIWNRSEDQVLGGTGLHTRAGAQALEIGYWIHADHINRGLATETAATLTRVAFEVNQVERVEIYNDPENVRSAAVPQKLGFVHEATLRQRTTNPDGEPRDAMIWTLLASEYPASPAAQAEIVAFDALGRRLL
jgi:RimJ/RimL family protein N-acetyltransferase